MTRTKFGEQTSCAKCGHDVEWHGKKEGWKDRGNSSHQRSKKGNPPMPKVFKWTVEFSVDESWVSDGFELTHDRALEMLENDLTYAYAHEIGVRIVKAPSSDAIRKAQGYAPLKAKHKGVAQ